MTITCHCSPDAGFTTLRPFLEGVKERFTVAMYDFTAPHILRALEAGMKKAEGDLDLNLDPEAVRRRQAQGRTAAAVPRRPTWTRTTSGTSSPPRWRPLQVHLGGRPVQGQDERGDLPERVSHQGRGARRQGVLALERQLAVVEPARHRPHRQAGGPQGGARKFNREWNIVVEHPGPGASFTRSTSSGTWSRPRSSRRRRGTRGLRRPCPTAGPGRGRGAGHQPSSSSRRTFTYTKEKPLQIQPVLTPDNYAEVVLKHIESAKKSLYFQNQYISINKRSPRRFDALLDALLAKIEAGLDVRIILRNLPDARQMLEALQLRGFDASKIRLQGTCHNKGIIVDSRAVALGSHNWSSDGTTKNRDATLIIHDPEVAAYYEQVFLLDWENQARQQTLDAEQPCRW